MTLICHNENKSPEDGKWS